MSIRHFTRKLFGLSKSKEMASQRPHSSQMPNKSRSRSKTPLRADDNNSPLWPRFYNRLVRKQNPDKSEEYIKYHTDARVKWRGEDRDKKKAREKARQQATKRGGKKRSRRKSRNLLSFLN
jgi:hypothetical protein